jgi:hypothetical protein
MGTPIGAETAKLAGLQIDTLQKLRDNQLTLDQFEWWNNLSSKIRERYMQPDFQDVTRGLASIVRVCLELACTKAFNPAEFFGNAGWTIWRGSAKGKGLEGEEECDKRADELEVVDWEKVILETHLQNGGTLVQGEEKLKRANASGNIQLGAKQCLSLWEDYKTNGKDSVLEKLRLQGVKRIYFFGTVLRSPSGSRCVLCLDFGGSEWGWRYYWLGTQWNAADPSASLASVDESSEL